MSKGKRNKRRKKRSRGGTHEGPFLFKHPFSDIPHETIIHGLIEHAKVSKGNFHESFNEIMRLLENVEPLQTIATLSVYGLTAGLSSDGKISPMHKDERFNQSHVELVQALCLRLPESESRRTPVDPSVIQFLFDTLPKLGESFIHQRMADMEKQRTEQQKAIILIQEHLRMHTQVVRNWGYFDKVLRLVNDLYMPLDDIFINHLGVPISKVISIFHHLMTTYEDSMTARMEMYRKVFAEKTVAGMVKQYYQCNPHFSDSANDFIAFVAREKKSVDQLKALIFAHSDLSLADICIFSAASISESVGVSEQSLDSILRKLSITLGDLAAHEPEFLILDNPVWCKPLICLGGGRYFCAMPQVFFGFVFSIVEDIIAGNEELKRACENRRAGFLETEIEHLFKQAFPGCEVVSNYKWRDGLNVYENDLLIRVDSHLLLIEAKSGRISWPALRGAPDRARRHIEELIYAPSLQSARLADRIREVIKDPELRETYFPGLKVSLNQVRTVLRLTVTFEDFAVIQSNVHMLKDTGWIPKQHILAPCILLADLEIVFDILKPMGQKIHYLRRRADLEQHMNYMGDELDLLGLYVSTGFNVGEVEFGGVHLQLTGMSREIDDYFNARVEGVDRSKPRLRLSRWWSDICTLIEQRGFYQWTDATNILLNIAFKEQNNAEKMFKKIKKNVHKKWRNPKHLSSVIITPPLSRTDAIVFFAYRDRVRDIRLQRMKEIVSGAFADSHVERCIVLAQNIDRKSYPYGTLAMFFPNSTIDRMKYDELVVY